jgi:hypothetical protein
LPFRPCSGSAFLILSAAKEVFDISITSLARAVPTPRRVAIIVFLPQSREVAKKIHKNFVSWRLRGKSYIKDKV